MFLFISPKRGTTPLGGEAIPIQQSKPTLLEILTGEETQLSMAVLFLILVILLHIWLGLWLLKPTESLNETQPLKVIEVALLAAPRPMPAVPLQASPKTIPAKKPPIKKPVKKQMPIIKKQAELPKPKPTIEEKLPSLPAESPVKPTVSEAKPVNKPVTTTSNERTNAQTIISGIVPLVRIQPKYPSRAVNRHIEGWVKIEFTITTTGTVKDATVVASQPDEVFDNEALKAIKKWQFKEKMVNGIATEQRAIQTLQFKLTE